MDQPLLNMSSYEIVRRAIEFDRPERLPVWFDALGISDFHSVKWNQIGVGDKKLRIIHWMNGAAVGCVLK